MFSPEGFVLISCTVLLVVQPGHGSEIIGGKEVKPHSMPYMALVTNPKKLCGGTLINPKWVLTAAHCEKMTTVALGVHSIRQKQSWQVFKVTHSIPHPAYKVENEIYYNDLMMLKLETEAKQTKNVKFLHLESPKRKPKTGSSCLTAGWGQTNEAVKKTSNVLMSVNVTVVDRMECSKYYGPEPVITKAMICAGSENKDTCQNVSTPWGRQESYKRFKRRIIQRRNIDGHSASTPLTSRGRREAAFESDAVRQRLELDSPPGPREQGVPWINSPVIAGGESTSCLANISTSHNLNTRRHTEDNLNQKWLWRPEALEHANARGTGRDEKRSDSKPFTVVDQNKTFAAPMLLDDYYCNLLDCSSHNTVALALGSSVYIWNAETHTVVGSLEPDPLSGQESISSLCWSEGGRTLCVGTRRGEIQLWDADCKHMTRCLLAHVSVVRAVSWKWPLLSSGSALGSIFHHDFRAPASLIGSVFQEEGLCSLQWSPDGGRLASGSIEGLLSIWDCSITGCTGMRSPVTAMKQPSVVKAMGWCPWQRNTIATGGGYQDGKLRIWDALSGTCETIANTNSQICSLRWAEKRSCLVTGHGLPQHHIACWSWDFASLNLTSQFTGHSQQVLYLALNTGNTQILSAGADKRLRIWDM